MSVDIQENVVPAGIRSRGVGQHWAGRRVEAVGEGDCQGRLHVWVAGLQAEVAPWQTKAGGEVGTEAVLPLKAVRVCLVPGDGDTVEAGVT